MPSIFETDAKLDLLAATAIARTKELMAQSDKLRDRREKANRKRVARLFKDPKAIEATITLTDEVMRISSIKSSSRIFRRAAKKQASLVLVHSMELAYISSELFLIFYHHQLLHSFTNEFAHSPRI